MRDATFLVCRHKTTLDLRAAKGELADPTWDDPLAAVLRERGQLHDVRTSMPFVRRESESPI